MKKLVFAAVLTVTAAALAESVTNKSPFVKVPMTPEEQAAARAALYKRTGGRVVKPGSQNGEVVYVNCQTEAKKEWLQFSADYFAKETKFKISVKDGKFDFAKPAIQGTVSLFVIDDPSMPNLLAAPENRWAMVNIAPLKCDKPQFFEARVKKELSRGFIYLCGGTNSQFPMSLGGGITGAEMLDQYEDHRLAVDIIDRFRRSMASFGITPALIRTYRRACEEGWAAAPTNEYQKAIWDKARELPSEPITIEKK